MIRLFWFSKKNLRTGDVTNFGDELSKHLVEKIALDSVKWVEPLKQNIFQKKFTSHVLGIGSILHFGAENSLIWGAGLIATKSKAPNSKYFAVRGKYTRVELQNRGFKVPEVYGDPGLLTPIYFPLDNNAPSKKVGIIPHYSEYDAVKKWFDSNQISKEMHLIDLRNNFDQVLKEIKDCSMIISSSLHGIIVPQAYGIPVLRVSFTKKLYGDGIKYKDYFSSVGIESYSHFVINKEMFNEKEIINYFKKMSEFSQIKKDLGQIQNELLKVKPF
jgi:pyruvyltransferase